MPTLALKRNLSFNSHISYKKPQNMSRKIYLSQGHLVFFYLQQLTLSQKLDED